VGVYEFRYSGRFREPARAIHRAREVAYSRGIHLIGEPVVTRRRVPIPIVGPKIEFVIRFEQATRNSER
jgi:hypothetical protein